MSEPKEKKGNKKLIILIVGIILLLALIAGVTLFFALGGFGQEEPTDPMAGYQDPTDPPELQGVWHCICGGSYTGTHLEGCNGEEYPWTEWTDATHLPITSGYYYLSGDVTLLDSENVANVTTSESIYLDLNGYTIHSSTRVYRVAQAQTDVNLTFLDSKGGGKVVMDTHANGASLVLVDSSGTKNITFFGGTYDGSALVSTGADGTKSWNGAMLRIGGGNLYIHGGTFIGAKDVQTGGVAYVQNGEFKMTGGEIMNGTAKNGGNVMLRTATFNMTGGKIHNGTAVGAENSRGGNIFSDRAIINISGTAEIYDGTCTYLGENIFTNQIQDLVNEGKVYFTHKEGHGIYPAPLNPEDPNHMVCICGSSTDYHLPECDGTKYAWRPWTETDSLPTVPGRFYLAVDVELANTAVISTAGNIHLDLNGKTISSTTRVFQMASAKIDNTLTVCDSVGGGEVVMSSYREGGTFMAMGNTGKKVLTLYGGTLNGYNISANGNGGVVRVGSATSKMNIYGGTVIGARYANAGGAIHVNQGVLKMAGGTIRSGVAKNGGNVFVSKGTLHMTGGRIYGGSAVAADGRGGNVFNNNGTVKIFSGARIYDGSCKTLGENYFGQGKNAKLQYASGTIYLSNSKDEGIYPIPKNPEDPNHKVCICGSSTDVHLEGCDGTKYAWRPWTSTKFLPSEPGRYYLAVDVDLKTTIEVETSGNILLDLNGHTVTTKTRAYLIAEAKVDNNFTVLDSVGGGKVVMTDYTEGGSFAAIGNTGNKKVTIYGGIFDASAIETTGNGGFLRVGSATSTLNVHGGTIIGAKSAANGGAIHINGGSMRMTGGEIKNGHSNNAGNIAITNGGTMIMVGGKIYGGSATADNGRGGNIFNNGSTLKVSGDAEIYDGSAVYLGENIFSLGEYTTEVEAGCAYFTDKAGDGIYPIPENPEDPNHMVCICGSSTDDHLEGCDGTKYAWRPWTNATSLPINAGKYYLAVDVELAATIDVTTSADIYLDLNGKTITSATRVYELAEAKADNTLTVLDSVGGGKVVLTDYTAGGSFATIGNTGNKNIVIYGGTLDASAIETTGNGGVIRVGSATSTLYVHGGTIIGAKSAANGGAIHINGGAVNMTGGEIKNGHSSNAGNIAITNGGSVNMTGGKIYGGSATASKGRGGNIFNNGGSLTISGTAEVYDGSAVTLGANIYNMGEYTFNNTGKVYLTGLGDATGIYPTGKSGCTCGSNSENEADHLPGCQGVSSDWSEWTNKNALPTTSGKYYLVVDVELAETAKVTSNADIYLDLNGKTITSTTRVYQLAEALAESSLTVLDSVGGGEVIMTDYTEGATFAAMGNTGNKTLTIYGGTFDVSAIETTGNGGFVRVASATSTMNMHGGVIIGAKRANQAGAVYVSGGTFNMTGGEIKNGNAASGGNVTVTNGGTMTMTGGQIHNGKTMTIPGMDNPRGGNIFNHSSTVTISGDAKVYDGTAKNGGANVYTTDTTTKAAVEAGCAYFTDKLGDGIYPVTSYVVTFNVNGGSAVDGQVVAKGGKATEPTEPTKTDYTFEGWYSDEACTAAWDFDTILTSDITLYAKWKSESGVYTVTFNTNGGSAIASQPVTEGGKATKPADPTKDSFQFAGWYSDAALTTAWDFDTVVTSDMTLYAKWSEWIELGEGAALPTTSGKYKLMADLSVSSQIDIKPAAGAPVEIVLDLNGHTITATGTTTEASVYNLNGENGAVTLTLMDSGSGGKIDLSGNMRFAYLISNENTVTLNIEGGIINGSDSFTKQATCVKAYGTKAVVEITGGTMNGGTTTSNGGVLMLDNKAVCNMSDGTIYGGTAGNGGNLLVQGGSTLNMTGGQIYGGTANHATNGRGGNIFNNNSTLNISGDAKVYNGTSTGNGKNIFSTGANYVVDAEAGCVYFTEDTGNGIYPVQFTVTFNTDGGSEIDSQKLTEGGKATKPANPTKGTYNFIGWYSDAALTTAWDFDTVVTGDLTLYAKWSEWTELGEGAALPTTSGKYKLMADLSVSSQIDIKPAAGAPVEIVLDLNGHTITATGTTTEASVYNLSGANETVSLTVMDSGSGGKIDLSGNMRFAYVASSAKATTLNINSGIINGSSNFTVQATCVKVYGSKVELNISGGTLNGGTTTHNCGTLMIDGGAVCNMTGGTIQGGSAGNGGNLLVQGGSTLNMTGGQIYGGTATHATNGRGGNIFNNNSTLNISGDAKVYNGTGTGNGKNIFSTGSNYQVNAEPGCVYFTGAAGNGIYPVQHTVVFNTDGGSEIASQKLVEGAKATKPTDPTKEGFRFVGWYSDAAFTTAWNFDTVVTGDMILYAQWTDWTELGEGAALPTTSGKYKLMANLSVSSEINLEPAAGSSVEIILDLNGHTITASSASEAAVYKMSGKNETVSLTLMDSKGGGKVDLSGNMRFVNLISNVKTTTFNMNGGIINGSKTATINGPSIKVYGTKAVVNMSGGTVQGGVSSNNGGQVHIEGATFNMTGGTICGGSAANGGNVLVQGGGKMLMSGGQIYGGQASNRGGNIFVSNNNSILVVNGSAKIYDGVVTNADATKKLGGNVWVLSGGYFYSSYDGTTGVTYDPATLTNVYLTGKEEKGIHFV